MMKFDNGVLGKKSIGKKGISGTAGIRKTEILKPE
jgi:hypothetical protein